MRTFPLCDLLSGGQADRCKYSQDETKPCSLRLLLSYLHYFNLLIRINENQVHHEPCYVWSCFYCGRTLLPESIWKQNLHISSLTDRPAYCPTRSGQYVYTHFYVGAACLKLSAALQAAGRLRSEGGQPGSKTRGGVNIHKTENTSQSA